MQIMLPKVKATTACYLLNKNANVLCSLKLQEFGCTM